MITYDLLPDHPFLYAQAKLPLVTIDVIQSDDDTFFSEVSHATSDYLLFRSDSGDLATVKAAAEKWLFEKVESMYKDLGGKKELHKTDVDSSLIARTMLTLDDYLNAGDKETRRRAAEKAKVLYREYYGVGYVNRNYR